MEFNPEKLKHITETFEIQASPNELASMLRESEGGEEYLLPRIEAIHAGRTKNFHNYLAEKLKGDPEKKSGVYSWTSPYNKPVIYNHDTETEATGRVITAAYAEYTSNGGPGIIIIPKITDKKAIQAIKDGRLLTVSVGATTDSIICSITGKDILKDGFTGYQKGEYYDGKLCEWILGDVWFDEVSWVNVPADENAQVMDIGSYSKNESGENSPESNTTESVSEKEFDKQVITFETNPSANRSFHELFGVPNGVSLIVSGLQEETDLNSSTAETEHIEQEDSAGMGQAENEEVQDVVDNIETDETTVETEDTVADDEIKDTVDDTKDDNLVEPDETETEVEANSDKQDDEEVKPVEKPEEASSDYQRLLVENAGLKAQNDALTKELKEHYINSIVQLKGFAESKKDAYVERLKSRTIESLKDTLTDMTFDNTSVEEEKLPAPGKNPPAQINSPLKTSEAVEKRQVLTEEEKVAAFAKLFLK